MSESSKDLVNPAEFALNPARGDHPAVLADINKAWQRFLDFGLSALTGSSVRAVIANSWQRARDQGVNPLMPGIAAVPDDDWVDSFVARNDFGIAGKAVLLDLAPVLKETRHVGMVADAAGRIFYAVGDSITRGILEDANVRPGVSGSEALSGTNGVGTSLATGAPVLVFGPEHFCERFKNWVCYGCPVREPDTGAILGTVNITTQLDNVQSSVIGLAVSVARSIEYMLQVHRLERRRVLLENFLQAERKWPSAGLVLTDASGRILELNHRSLEILNEDSRLSVGRSIASYFPEARPLLDCECAGGWAEMMVQRRGDSFRMRLGSFAAGDRVLGHLVVVSPAAPSLNPPSRADTTSRQPGRRRGPAGLCRFDEIIGRSAAFIEALALAQLAGNSDRAVLLTGETGTGKELFAQAIHSASSRARGPFVAINCGALPSALIESELFGHVPGAFTGASRFGAAGKFEVASEGTILLDEISAMPLELQATLLRVLETKAVTRLGACSPIHTDVRVIVASNEDLAELASRGRFRRDLFFRLNVLSIELPPLRQRSEDIILLATTFLSAECERIGRGPIRLAPEVNSLLLGYSWPGNVRELKHLCERWAALIQGDTVNVADLPPAIRCAGRTWAAARAPSGRGRGPLNAELVRRTIAENGSNVSEAARRLGVSRTAIYKWLRRTPDPRPNPVLIE